MHPTTSRYWCNSLTFKEIRIWAAAKARRLLRWGNRKAVTATLTMLRWGIRLPMGLRSVIGVLTMIVGVFGFLPVVGFWMIPLGLAFIALDLPWTRQHVHNWMERLEQRVERAG